MYKFILSTCQSCGSVAKKVRGMFPTSARGLESCLLTCSPIDEMFTKHALCTQHYSENHWLTDQQNKHKTQLSIILP